MIALDSGKCTKRQRSGDKPLLYDVLRRTKCRIARMELLPSRRGVVRRYLYRLTSRGGISLVTAAKKANFTPHSYAPRTALTITAGGTPKVTRTVQLTSLRIAPETVLDHNTSIVHGRALVVGLPKDPGTMGRGLRTMLPSLRRKLTVLAKGTDRYKGPLSTKGWHDGGGEWRENVWRVVSRCKEAVRCLHVSIASQYGLHYICYVPRRNVRRLPRRRVLAFSRVREMYQVDARLKVSGVGLANKRPLIEGKLPSLLKGVGEVSKVRRIALAAGKVLLGGRLSRLVHRKLSTIGVDVSALSRAYCRAIAEYKRLGRTLRKLRTTLRCPGLHIGLGYIPVGRSRRRCVRVTRCTGRRPLRIHFVRVVPVKVKGTYRKGSESRLLRLLRGTFKGTRPCRGCLKGNPTRCMDFPKFRKEVKFVDTIDRGFYSSYGEVQLATRKCLGLYLRCRDKVSLEGLLEDNTASRRIGRTVHRTV